MLHGFKIAALCISRIHELVLQEFLQALNQSLTAQGWRVLVYTTGADLYWKTRSNMGEETIFDLIDLETTDALITFKDKIQDEECLDRICRRAVSHNIPVFLVNGKRDDCCSINFDYEVGFAEVVRHLINCHHITDFHYISGFRGNEFSEARKAVMKRVLDEYGLPFDESRVSYGDFWSAPARAATKALIEENRLPQAIVCANDAMAIAVCAELSANGYKVPRDVLVTGFDGLDAINYSIPKMSSAKCDYAELGRTIAELAVKAGNGETPPPQVDLIPQLILSESCGCVPETAIDIVDFINHQNDVFHRFRNEDEKLSEIASQMMSSDSLQEVSGLLHDGLFYSMICMLKQECIDFSLDPMMVHSGRTFGEELYVLQDTDWYPNEGTMVPLRELAPRMEELLEVGMPLIFIALHHIDIPLGYLCFHFGEIENGSFLKINQIAMSLSSAIAGFRSKHYQQHLQMVVEEMYKYDALTGLYNRSAFLKSYQQMLADEQVGKLTLVLCDLDGLKYINDHFSHKEGDNAISVVANAMHDVCRDGLCCRYGGDELVAMLTTSDLDAAHIREEILRNLSRYNERSRKPYDVSASIGIYSSADENFEEMFGKADALMYQDKANKPHRR